MATKTTGSKTYPTRNDIPASQRPLLVDLLNARLADLTDLYTQTKFAHWNVKGPSFIGLHKLFDELAEEVLEHVDTVAERATALGGVARGTVRQAAAASQLEEFPEANFDGMAVVAALADRFGAAGGMLRSAIDEADELGDKDTADMFTDVSRDIDKSLYFLEAHIQKSPS